MKAKTAGLHVGAYWFSRAMSAEDASQCHYDGDFGIWQYSGSGSCAGITGTVDLDYGYIDYPSIIKHSGLNGYGK